MNKLFRPSAAAALFVTAAFVACNGNSGYTPANSQAFNAQASGRTEPLNSFCTAKELGPGTYLAYFTYGNVKNGTFTVGTGKSAIAEWELIKYKRTHPTPPPSPSPTPSESPTPSPSPSPTATPKPVKYYLYYGQFSTKNKQVGCTYLETTVKGEHFKGSDYNADTEGAPVIKLTHYSEKGVTIGNIKQMTVSHLSSKGGSGTMTLVQKNGSPYTTGSVTLNGREEFKDVKQLQNDIKRLLFDH